MRLHPTCRVISKPTAVWIRDQRNVVSSAVRRTCRCRRWRCTCSPTEWATCAASAESSSRGLGYCAATCALTPAKSRTTAVPAARRSRTAPTSALTSRLTRPIKSTSAPAATRHSHSKATSTNTRNRRAFALKTSETHAGVTLQRTISL